MMKGQFWYLLLEQKDTPYMCDDVGERANVCDI
jgi:hypothetical protein